MQALYGRETPQPLLFKTQGLPSFLRFRGAARALTVSSPGMAKPPRASVQAAAHPSS